MKSFSSLTKTKVTILVALALLLSLSSCSVTGEDPQGRYELVISSQENAAFVIDTTTGQVWSSKPRTSRDQAEFFLRKSDETSGVTKN